MASRSGSCRRARSRSSTAGGAGMACSRLSDKRKHLQSRPTHGTIACVGYDSVAQWIRALPCGGRGRAFESPQGHHRSEGRSRTIASGRPSERLTIWGGDRAVECARLENELGVKAYVGSNPTLPATGLKSGDSQFRGANRALLRLIEKGSVRAL